MADFSNLSELKVPGKQTALYTFYDIEGEPSILSRPAAECNSRYYNALLVASRRLARRKSGSISLKFLRQNRENDYDLYAKYISQDWGTMPVDVDGQDVPFSPESCEEFLRAIPTDMFDDYRAWCVDLGNFRDVTDEDDLEALEGN